MSLRLHTLIRTCLRFSRCTFLAWMCCRRSRTFFELTYAYLQRVNAQNVVYTEMHFDPQAHTSRGIAFDTVIRGIRRAQEMAQDELGIRSQLILGILRDMSVESAMEALEQSLAYRGLDRGRGAGL